MLHMDHLVVACETLSAGVEYVEELLGAAMSAGGRHDFMGTHNALVSLGPNAYLEVIAIDPAATPPTRPRWFDLDRFSGPPRLTNWICRCTNPIDDLARAPLGIGAFTRAARADLSWQITIPENGRLPYDGCFPGLIGWDGDAHPSQNLPDHHIRLEMLKLSHPLAADLAGFAQKMFENVKYEILKNDQVSIMARLQTPHGARILT